MDCRRIRPYAVFLVVSFVVLTALASEAQAMERHYALCASGRCIRAAGTATGILNNSPIRPSAAVVMVDLVYHYAVIEMGELVAILHGYIAISYGRFSVYASWSFGPPAIYGHVSFMPGLPGFASAHFVWTGTHGIDVGFAGLGSFYYRMEQCPKPEWCAK